MCRQDSFSARSADGHGLRFQGCAVRCTLYAAPEFGGFKLSLVVAYVRTLRGSEPYRKVAVSSSSITANN